MAQIDREIDRLYQLPLSEFTAARDELAKRAEADRGAIKRLQKPHLAAWAINQLYWRERDAYDALVTAAQRLRAVQTDALKGRTSDVPRAETAHRATLKAATDRIRRLLRDAGETASSATMNAVNDTLQALPASESPGRLTRPLKPLGFEALTGLLMPVAKSTRPAAVLPFKPKSEERTGKRDAAAAKRSAAEAKRELQAAQRAAHARAREAAKVAAQLREARTTERAATAALSRARAGLARAEHEHRQLAERLETSAAELERRTEEIRDRQQAVSAAAAAREQLETRLETLRAD
jgi:hypothetical protein